MNGLGNKNSMNG